MAGKTKINVLNVTTKTELNEAISEYVTPHRYYQRLIAMRIIAEGNTIQSAANIIGFKYQTVHGWAKKCEKEGIEGLIPNFGGGRPSKLSQYQLKELDEKLRSRNAYKNFFMFVMGILISAFAVSVLYEPHDIVTSGSTGIAILLTKIIDIDLSLMIFALCSLLLVIGFAVFGLEYGSKNILITILSPIFVKTTSLLLNIIEFNEVSLFLLAVLAGILSGIGTGLVRKSGYYTGGLGIIYDILNIKFKMSIGTATMICNTIIMGFSLFMFGLSSCIYGFVALYVSSLVVDRVMIGISNNKAFYIITKKHNDVKEYIVNNLNHTVTIVNAKGGYSNKRKKMLMCVIPTIEYIRVKEVIREIDKDVFFLITDSYYVSK